jgi:hypothetical protein
MKHKPWHKMQPLEIKILWDRFKQARKKDKFVEHALAVRHSDWISCVERESIIEALISKLSDAS